MPPVRAPPIDAIPDPRLGKPVLKPVESTEQDDLLGRRVIRHRTGKARRRRRCRRHVRPRRPPRGNGQARCSDPREQAQAAATTASTIRGACTIVSARARRRQ